MLVLYTRPWEIGSYIISTETKKTRDLLTVFVSCVLGLFLLLFLIARRITRTRYIHVGTVPGKLDATKTSMTFVSIDFMYCVCVSYSLTVAVVSTVTLLVFDG